MRLSAAIALAVVITLGALPVVAQEPVPALALTVPPTAAPPETAGPPEVPAPTPPDATAPERDVTPAPSAGAAAPAARFVIEKIVVEGVKHGSEKIVTAETLLTLGGSYTEPQLQQALHRVERLPFVVQADFSMRRGSERGRFELVITVTETMPVFLGGSVWIAADDWIFSGQQEIGARVFFGDHSEVRVGVSGGLNGSPGTDVNSNAGFSVAYSHHNLFGRHVVVGASIRSARSALGGGDGTYTSFNASAQLAFPLSRADALQVEVSRYHIENRVADPSSFLTFNHTRNAAGVSWQHDTTDDPFTPHRGSSAAAGVGYSADFSSYQEVGDLRNGNLSGSLRGSHYWPLRRRLSIGVGGALSGATDIVRVVESTDSWSVDASLDARLLGIMPWGRGSNTHYWWEIGASVNQYRFHSGSEDRPEFSFTNVMTHKTLSASISARGRWGTVMLALQYSR